MPLLHLREMRRVHVEEMRHGRENRRVAAIIQRRPHRAPEDLEGAAIPILGRLMQRGEAGVDDGAEIGADRLPPRG